MTSLLLIAALLHPVHATLAEIEWNPKTGRLEVAVRIDSLDEQWLRKRHGDAQARVKQWAIPYLSRSFRIACQPKPKEPDSTKYHWIGRQQDGAHVWWYFEIEPRDQKSPEWIEQRMLLERENDYAHHIVILNSNPKRALTLNQQQPRGALAEPSDNLLNEN